MTGSPKRRWLILSYAFNVDGRAESLTITDKIPHLVAAGIEPVVLSSVMGLPMPGIAHHQLLPWGPSAMRFDLRHVLLRRWGRDARYRVVMALATLLLAPFIAVERLVSGVRSQWSWALPAVWHGRRLVRDGGVELVYSTGGVFSAHLAGWWLKRLTGCRWIAEVHDPLVWPGSAPRNRHERFLAKLEGWICRDADLAWWFTDGALEAARRRHRELDGRGIVVLPGAEPPLVRVEYRRGPQCVFGHFGSLSPTRSLAPALRALATLLERHPDWRKLVRLEVYGSQLDPDAAHALQALGLHDVVVPMGRLEFDPATGLSGRARVVQRMQQVDVLLMVHGELEDCLEYIPSKLYDYFWARRPVLGLTHRNAQLDALVTTHGGWVAPSTDPAAIVAAFEAAFERWQRDALPDATVPPVTVASAVQRILEAVGHG
jgi:glycosyltransferase involved in cell wall biosynthesis